MVFKEQFAVVGAGQAVADQAFDPAAMQPGAVEKQFGG
jgi:hypothetical protein